MEIEPRDEDGGSSRDDEARAVEDGGRDESASHSRPPSAFQHAWLFVAAALLVAAAIFLLRSHTDAAFVCAALGACAWFLDFREGLKRKHDLRKRGHRNWEPRGDDGE